MDIQAYPATKPPAAIHLLSLPTATLLEKFGSGSHKPGSGSAAALNGILACKLAITVTQLTRQREGYSLVSPQLDLVEARIRNEIEPQLVKLFSLDSAVFDRVIHLRRQRDAETDEHERRRLREEAIDALREATDIPIEIARHCMALATLSLSIFDMGFRAARGDSGVAVSTALAGAQGALFIAYLNLTKFRESAWAIERRRICGEMLGTVQDTSEQLMRRVIRLSDEGADDAQLPLFSAQA